MRDMIALTSLWSPKFNEWLLGRTGGGSCNVVKSGCLMGLLFQEWDHGVGTKRKTGLKNLTAISCIGWSSWNMHVNDLPIYKSSFTDLRTQVLEIVRQCQTPKHLWHPPLTRWRHHHHHEEMRLARATECSHSPDTVSLSWKLDPFDWGRRCPSRHEDCEQADYFCPAKGRMIL